LHKNIKIILLMGYYVMFDTCTCYIMIESGYIYVTQISTYCLLWGNLTFHRNGQSLGGCDSILPKGHCTYILNEISIFAGKIITQSDFLIGSKRSRKFLLIKLKCISLFNFYCKSWMQKCIWETILLFLYHIMLFG
jgi:hypothetical protein